MLGSWFWVLGSWFWVLGSWFWVLGSWFWVLGPDCLSSTNTPWAADGWMNATREPSAYIMGRREFWGLTLEVSPAVLIPRPETELIVEAALDVFGSRRDAPLDVADACTGSGNLAIALALELRSASIVATDISDHALGVARRNAARHGVTDRIRFVCADLLNGIDGPFDLIVANPPYVQQRARPVLAPEVRDHEPSVALFGGDIGIELVATVVEQSATRLGHGGYLIFEFGLGQDVEVEELIAATPGLTMIGLRRDLQDIARTAVARKTEHLKLQAPSSKLRAES